MTELINPPAIVLSYDPDSNGWVRPDCPDGPLPRPASARVRCGSYLHPQSRARMWGDHRVSFPGTTCREVSCYVSHHPHIAPGWPEPPDPATDGHDLYGRPGAAHIASALWGWTDAGHLPLALDEQHALHAAHLALDALRDAGYTIIAPPTAPGADAPGAGKSGV